MQCYIPTSGDPYHFWKGTALIIPWNWNEVIPAKDRAEGNFTGEDSSCATTSLARCHPRLYEVIHSSELPMFRGLVPTFLAAQSELQ